MSEGIKNTALLAGAGALSSLIIASPAGLAGGAVTGCAVLFAKNAMLDNIGSNMKLVLFGLDLNMVTVIALAALGLITAVWGLMGLMGTQIAFKGAATLTVMTAGVGIVITMLAKSCGLIKEEKKEQRTEQQKEQQSVAGS